MATIRVAREDEDDYCALLFANSFLPVWNHNWFQGLTAPISQISQNPETVQKIAQLPKQQYARIIFYRFIVKITRSIGGDVIVATRESENLEARLDHTKHTIVAVLLFHPPNHRVDLSLNWQSLCQLPHTTRNLYNAGLLKVLNLYGLDSFRRVNIVFQGLVDQAFAKSLPPLGVSQRQCGFVQLVAVDYQSQGCGYGREILEWTMQKHFKTWPSTPIILDTTTMQAASLYLKLGFKIIGEYRFDGDYDINGYRLSPTLTTVEVQRIKQKTKTQCVGRIMIKLPS